MTQSSQSYIPASTLVRITVRVGRFPHGVRQVMLDDVACKLVDRRERPYKLVELWYAPEEQGERRP